MSHEGQGDPNERFGSDNDVKRLKSTLPFVGLSLYKNDCHQDLSKVQMESLIMEFATDRVHETADCAVLIVMAHGDNESLRCDDGEHLNINRIIEMFSNDIAKHLIKKPVILMFVTCRYIF
jgi:hypothetical protein